MKHLRVGKLLFALLVVTSLPGCFPLVATGVVGTGLVVADRRTTGTQLDDQSIEAHASNAIENQFTDRVHVNATCFNRNLLLTGEVPDQATRNALEALAKGLVNVRSVIDETSVAANSSFSQRTSDSYLSTKVHTRLMTESHEHYSPVQISVTTENGIVYLMGLVTRGEGDAAANVARTTSGVRQVVKVFEYIDTVAVPAPDKRPIGEIQAEPGPSAESGAAVGPATAGKSPEAQPPAPQTEDVLPPAQPVKM